MKLQDKTLRIDGEVLVRRPPSNLSHAPKSGKQFIHVGSTLKNVSDVLYIKEMRVIVQYQRDIKTWPDKAAMLDFIVEVVRKLGDQHGFVALRRRWVVERTFGWMMPYRRLVRNYEQRLDVSENMIYAAMGSLLMKRIFN